MEVKAPHFSKETERSMFQFFLKHSAPLIYEDKLKKRKELNPIENQSKTMAQHVSR